MGCGYDGRVMTRFQPRRLFALCLLLAAAAGPLPGCSRAATTAQVAGVDDAIHGLAAGGVAVMEDFLSTTPTVAISGAPSAMRFTRWQVQNMVGESNAHSGYIGSELDTLAQPPAGSPPLSTLIGAWLIKADGALAQYAAGLMGPQDYKHAATIVFPTIVVLSFIGDIARGTTTSQLPHKPFDPEALFASPAEAEGSTDACSAIAGWVSNVVTNVTAAIQSNGTGWLSSLWNTVVTIAGAAISVVINHIVQPLVTFITTIATVCGTIMQVASMFKPWSVQLAGNPGSIHLGSAPVDGTFVATLTAQDIPWPSSLVGCVIALSNVKLDDASYTDAPITWTPKANIPGLATATTSDTTLQKDKTASYHFQTITGPSVGGCMRTVPDGNISVSVSVARTDVTRTLQSLESLITNQLPSGLRTYLGSFIDPAIADANSTVAKFAAPHETGSIAVTEDVEDPLCSQTPPPNTPTTQPTTVSGTATMPGGPCASLLTASDTAPLQGVVYIPVDEHGNKIDMGKMMVQMMSGTLFQVPGGQQPAGEQAIPAAPDYDQTKGSFCTIGVPQKTLVAFFGVEPKGVLPYHRAATLEPDAPDGLHACRTQIGIDLLNHFNADCRGFSAGPAASITVVGPDQEYIIVGAGGPVATEAAEIAVLQNVLRSHQ
jgi:hypothetical protein